MYRVVRRSVALLGLLAMLLGSITLSAAPAEAQSSCSTPVVTASHPAVGNFGAHLAFDGKWATFFFSSFDNWQHLQVDFGCVGTFSGLRRSMTLGFGSTPNRGPQGEAVSYSVDGVTWTNVLASTSTGWEGYVNYRPHAWHTVEYGWSEPLRLTTPVPARYVRFNWDGDGDFLHEVEIDFARPFTPPPLTVQVNCDVGIVSCQASASGGSGHQFTWTPRSNATINQQNDRGSTSWVAGTCRPGSNYTVDVTVSDNTGRTTSASATRRCLAIIP